MSPESNCQCVNTQQPTYVSSISYTHTVVKTTISYKQVQHDMMSDVSQVPTDRGKLNLTEVMSQLADIRLFLKPWFFPGASQHNMEVARQYATDIVNRPEFNQEVSFEVIVKKLQFDNNITLDTSRFNSAGQSCCDSSGNRTLLSEQDKCMLEEVHNACNEEGLDSRKVHGLAGLIVSERLGEGQNPVSLDDKHFLESALNKVGLGRQFDIGSLRERLVSRVENLKSELHHV